MGRSQAMNASLTAVQPASQPAQSEESPRTRRRALGPIVSRCLSVCLSFSAVDPHTWTSISRGNLPTDHIPRHNHEPNVPLVPHLSPLPPRLTNVILPFPPKVRLLMLLAFCPASTVSLIGSIAKVKRLGGWVSVLCPIPHPLLSHSDG